MPQRKRYRRRKRYSRKGKRKYVKKKSVTCVTMGKLALPKGMAPSPDKLIPTVFKTTLHTRIVKTLDAGASTPDYDALQLTLNTAGKPIYNANAYAYGVSPKCWQAGSYTPGSRQRDLGNLFNYYENAYCLSAIVKARFINGANGPAPTGVPSTVALTGLIDGNAEVDEAFALMPHGFAIGNFEEMPGHKNSMTTMGETPERQTVTIQRGYSFKSHFMGKKAQSYIGNSDYATTWAKNQTGLTAPTKKVKACVIQKNLANGLDPGPCTVIVDVYQTVLFTDLRTADMSSNPANTLSHVHDYIDQSEQVMPS